MEKTLTMVEDADGDGVCGHCGREGIRWLATFDDGAKVGLQCARKHLGVKVSVKDVAWSTGFRPVAQHREHGLTFVLWDNGRMTNTTRNGLLDAVGGERAVWERNGWL
ncbi:hypothetical protein [Agromyces humi]|uniref:hypothetical protein n=1 Tax=Agromyces humi TaxID=1766800 RepID=UPI00135A918F|nr:hypothetical protein [Agromyces humi]